jgi:hypothetical protein
MKTTQLSIKMVNWSHLRDPIVLIALVLASFAFSQTVKAQDGDELNQNTAEGSGALHTYIATANGSSADTAIGYLTLYSNTTGFQNTATGAQALQKNTTGSENTATGDNALFSNTTGAKNTAVGTYALQSNDTGIDNTATGDAALRSNNTGAQNTANGYTALLFNNAGNDNTAIGFQALMKNDGMDNTAVGSGALSGGMAFDTTFSFSTAVGFNALLNNTASNNTAVGDQALLTNTTGTENTAIGPAALFKNTSGNNNTASGLEALFSNTTGSNNTADGLLALESNTSGHDNVAEGFQALANNKTGSLNIAIGSNAGMNVSTGSNNIDIGAPGVAGDVAKIRIGRQGTQNGTFIAGIYNIAVTGSTVVVNSSGKLGVAASSARFKEQIKPMNNASEAILKLRPVSFRYKAEVDPAANPQFGLVAEEVEKVAPDLVVYDVEGKPFTVRYEALNTMLLNEFLKEHRKVDEQQATIDQLKTTATQQQKQIEALTAAVQKVNEHLELNRTDAQRIVGN